MLRLNILLLTIVVATALGTVAANHRARNLVTAFEKEQGETQRLNVEWGQLQLELSTWANHARVEKIAREQLHMHAPAPAKVIMLDGGQP